MQALLRMLRLFAYGLLSGAGIAAIALLFGFLGGQGWQRGRAAGAQGIILILLLVFLGGLVVTTGYRSTLRLNLDEENLEARSTMMPVTLGITLALLAAYLWTTPPLPSAP